MNKKTAVIANCLVLIQENIEGPVFSIDKDSNVKIHGVSVHADVSGLSFIERLKLLLKTAKFLFLHHREDKQ